MVVSGRPASAAGARRPARPRSSAGQSIGLLIRGSQVRILPGALKSPCKPVLSPWGSDRPGRNMSRICPEKFFGLVGVEADERPAATPDRARLPRRTQARSPSGTPSTGSPTVDRFNARSDRHGPSEDGPLTATTGSAPQRRGSRPPSSPSRNASRDGADRREVRDAGLVASNASSPASATVSRFSPSLEPARWLEPASPLRGVRGQGRGDSRPR